MKAGRTPARDRSRASIAGLALGAALALGAGCRRAPPPCNALANDAQPVPFTPRPGPPPAFTGGAIRDGIYFAARADGYGAAPPAGRRMTLAVSDGGTRLAWAGEVLDAGGVTVAASIRANARISVAGSRLALTTTCASVSPSPLPDRMAFSASTGELVLGYLDGATASVTTYRRVDVKTDTPR